MRVFFQELLVLPELGDPTFGDLSAHPISDLFPLLFHSAGMPKWSHGRCQTIVVAAMQIASNAVRDEAVAQFVVVKVTICTCSPIEYGLLVGFGHGVAQLQLLQCSSDLPILVLS